MIGEASTNLSHSSPSNTPTGQVGNLISAVLFVVMIAAMALTYSLGEKPESKFNDALAQTYQRGVDYMFEKTADGKGMAVNVVLDMGWERTPLLKDVDVDQERYLVARFTYPRVEFSEQGAQSLMEKLEKDINSLVEGSEPVNFQGFSTTSPFSVAGSNMAKMGAIPSFIAWGFVAMATLMLVLGRRAQPIRLFGQFSVMTLLVLLAMMALHYQGVFAYSPVITTPLT